MAKASPLLPITRSLSKAVDQLSFSAPVHTVYNPLDYAAKSHGIFLERFGQAPKRIVFLGMNPGPYGMAQTGVPFGEIPAVRDWMAISAPVQRPDPEHPKRPVTGFDCTRSEVSGRRLWGLFAEKFGTPEAFFADHFVLNYCPLVFMGETGANITPDKLPAKEKGPLDAVCDAHLGRFLEVLQPEWVVGVGGFAQKKAAEALDSLGGEAFRIGKVLHPSPASPAANRGWAEAATRQLAEQKIW